MQEFFTQVQLKYVLDQAIIYQCACPAQVCKSILDLRALFAYQVNCAQNDSLDENTHALIAQAVEKSHSAMEDCLKEIFELQGWDMNSLQMPESLKNKALNSDYHLR